MRYIRNNIVRIVDVAIQERKDSITGYKTAPAAYIKVEWQVIDGADQELLARNTSFSGPITQ
jgi:hypothetical protein